MINAAAEFHFQARGETAIIIIIIIEREREREREKSEGSLWMNQNELIFSFKFASNS